MMRNKCHEFIKNDNIVDVMTNISSLKKYVKYIYEYGGFRDEYFQDAIEFHTLDNITYILDFLKRKAVDKLDPDFEGLRGKLANRMTACNFLMRRFKSMGIRIMNVVTEHKLLKELCQKDIPNDAMLCTRPLASSLLEHYRLYLDMDIVDRILSGGFDKMLIDQLKEKLEKLGVHPDEMTYAMTPLRLYAPLYVLYKHSKGGEDLGKHFLFSRLALDRFFVKSEPFPSEKIEEVESNMSFLRTVKRRLADKYGDIIWQLELLLLEDNSYLTEFGRLAFGEVEEYELRRAILAVVSRRQSAGIDRVIKIDELLDIHTKASSTYVFHNITHYHPQRYHCVVAASINALSLWSNTIRQMRENELRNLELEVYLESRAKPYGDIMAPHVLSHLADKFGINDILYVYDTKAGWEWVDDVKMWSVENSDFIFKKLSEYGLKPLIVSSINGRNVSGHRTELSMDFIKVFSEYNRDAIRILLNDQRLNVIRSRPTVGLLKSAINEGYSIVITHPVRGFVQHAVTLSGYSNRRKRFYTYDQLSGSVNRIPYHDITSFTELPAGWTFWGFRKHLDGIKELEESNQEMKKYVKSIKSLVQASSSN